jgi:hypothetical protein
MMPEAIRMDSPRNMQRIALLRFAMAHLQAQLDRLNAKRFGYHVHAGELHLDDGSVHDGFVIRSNKPDDLQRFLLSVLDVDTLGITIITEKCTRCDVCQHEKNE